jgi:hypothetical protein
MNGRRNVLRAAAALAALLCIRAASAQDPHASIVQSAARDWLVLADKGDGGATWDAAGAQFRKAIARDRWSEALKSVREPFGAMTQRSMFSTVFRKTIPGAPEGEYALVVYRTAFAKRDDTRETVTLEHESDGAWRVVGYGVQ